MKKSFERLGINIKTIRQNIIGVSLPEMKEKTGIHRTLYIKYENGEADPDNDSIKKISEALGVSIDLLYNDDQLELRHVSIDRMLHRLRNNLMQFQGSEKYLVEFLNLLESKIAYAKIAEPGSGFSTFFKIKLSDN